MLALFLSLVALMLLVVAFRAEGEEMEETSDKVIELIEQAPKPHIVTDLDTLHSEICKKVKESPLCDDIELLRRIDSTLVGISSYHSHSENLRNSFMYHSIPFYSWANLWKRRKL